jgi:hypothetical protein
LEEIYKKLRIFAFIWIQKLQIVYIIIAVKEYKRKRLHEIRNIYKNTVKDKFCGKPMVHWENPVGFSGKTLISHSEILSESG